MQRASPMKMIKGTILFSLLLAAGACDRNTDRSTTPTQPATQTSSADEDANTTNAGNLDERRNDTGNTGADSPAGQQGAEAAQRENQGTSTDPATNTPAPSGTSTTPGTTTPGTTTPGTTTPGTTTPGTQPAPTPPPTDSATPPPRR